MLMENKKHYSNMDTPKQLVNSENWSYKKRVTKYEIILFNFNCFKEWHLECLENI